MKELLADEYFRNWIERLTIWVIALFAFYLLIGAMGECDRRTNAQEKFYIEHGFEKSQTVTHSDGAWVKTK